MAVVVVVVAIICNLYIFRRTHTFVSIHLCVRISTNAYSTEMGEYDYMGYPKWELNIWNWLNKWRECAHTHMQYKSFCSTRNGLAKSWWDCPLSTLFSQFLETWCLAFSVNMRISVLIQFRVGQIFNLSGMQLWFFPTKWLSG